jgi:hypothetical protein
MVSFTLNNRQVSVDADPSTPLYGPSAIMSD